MLQLFLLLLILVGPAFAQSGPTSCPDLREAKVSKGTEVVLCIEQLANPNATWIRVRRSPVTSGLYTHWQKLALSTFQTVPINNVQMLVGIHTFRADKTYHYCVNTVYKLPNENFERETPCSSHAYLEVSQIP